MGNIILNALFVYNKNAQIHVLPADSDRSFILKFTCAPTLRLGLKLPAHL